MMCIDDYLGKGMKMQLVSTNASLLLGFISGLVDFSDLVVLRLSGFLSYAAKPPSDSNPSTPWPILRDYMEHSVGHAQISPFNHRAF